MFRSALLFSALILFLISVIPTSFAIDPLERISVTSPRLLVFGENYVIEHVNVNQQVQVTADITNNQDTSQKFVYIVQIKDEDDVIISLASISGDLNPHQTFSSSLSWAPDRTGSFVAEIFVWESLSNQDALSEMTSFRINTS